MFMEHDPGRDKRFATALSWNLDHVKTFMVKREHYDPAYVEELANEYRRFLGIIAYHRKERFPISEAVDKMWHTHILFTRDYTKMSKAVRGEYIHHEPVLSIEEKLALEPTYRETTLVRYHELYHVVAPVKFWPIDGQICWSGYQIHT